MCLHFTSASKKLSFLTENHSRFCQYFRQQYLTRATGNMLPQYTVVNTNMFVEAFHSCLKVVHFKKKQNRRIDRLIHVILKYACDLVYDRLMKFEKDKQSHRIREINKRQVSTRDAIICGSKVCFRFRVGCPIS